MADRASCLKGNMPLLLRVTMHTAGQQVLDVLVGQAAEAAAPALVAACTSLIANLARATSLRLAICRAPCFADCLAHAQNADSHTTAIVLRLIWNLAGKAQLAAYFYSQRESRWYFTLPFGDSVRGAGDTMPVTQFEC